MQMPKLKRPNGLLKKTERATSLLWKTRPGTSLAATETSLSGAKTDAAQPLGIQLGHGCTPEGIKKHAHKIRFPYYGLLKRARQVW